MFKFDRIVQNDNNTVLYAVLVDGAQRVVVVTRWRAADAVPERVLVIGYDADAEDGRYNATVNGWTVAKVLAADPLADPDAVLADIPPPLPKIDAARVKAEAQQADAERRSGRRHRR